MEGTVSERVSGRTQCLFLGTIIQSHPEACKALFVKDVHNDDDQVDANFLFSSLRPSYSPKGSSRGTTEESMMDFFQDFLFNLEDEPLVNAAMQRQ